MTKGTSVAGVTGVSLMKLGAGLQRDEEEEPPNKGAKIMKKPTAAPKAKSASKGTKKRSHMASVPKEPQIG